MGPQVSNYIAEFDRELAQRRLRGLAAADGVAWRRDLGRARLREPLALVESGPVGGCIGAASYGQLLGLENLIAFDMGGTTAKCAMVERGRFAVESIYHVGGPDAGFPVRGNVIDIVEVGAGGGSIAWIDEQRRMHVGPRSAGSMPGPACYGRGGAEPTVTDANLVLGRLDPDHFLGGEMRLATGKAREVLAGRIAGPLGYGGDDAVTRAANGVLTLANLTMTSIIKKISIARGYDPRDFALFCYGGGGPLHGVELARALHIPRVIVPPEPGNFSALGMLLADARLDTAQTFVVRLNPENLAKVRGGLRRAREPRAGRRCAASSATAPITFEREAEMRYKGQHHSIKIPLAESDDAATLRARSTRNTCGATATPMRPRRSSSSCCIRSRPCT